MPIIRSAKKALRQSMRRAKQNLLKKEAYRHLLKETRRKIDEGKKEDAKILLPRLYKALDKAAKTNAISKNKASRLKSRTARLTFSQ